MPTPQKYTFRTFKKSVTCSYENCLVIQNFFFNFTFVTLTVLK